MSRARLVAVLLAAILMVSTVAALADSPRAETAGAVYTMTNNAAGNQVVIFDRDEDGILTKAGSLPTGGTGSGGGLDPLGSQGSLVLSQNARWLLAVNAGSNEISVFRVLPHGLALTDTVGSGGTFPVSVTIFHDLVYVLNAQGAPNITGFKLSNSGQLTPLAGSTRSLGTGTFGQVGFDPGGDTLVVTDRGPANRILVYSVGARGLPATNPVISPSNGTGPFGFIFDKREHLLVVEVTSNAVSSYDILDNETLQVISPSVPNGQAASCWITGNERGFIFTGNPGAHSISSFSLKAGSGKLTLLKGVAGTGNTPIDLSTVDSRFLYALDPSRGGIDMFKVEHDGSLTALGAAADGLSIFAQGIAAH